MLNIALMLHKALTTLILKLCFILKGMVISGQSFNNLMHFKTPRSEVGRQKPQGTDSSLIPWEQEGLIKSRTLILNPH